MGSSGLYILGVFIFNSFGSDAVVRAYSLLPFYLLITYCLKEKSCMQVSIIIVTYNTLQMTKECIDSVVDKTKDVEYEIILVDNASSDGSKEFFEKIYELNMYILKKI